MNETKTGINGVRSVDFGLPDLEEASRYYEELWGLTAVAKTENSVYLRGTGPDHYLVGLHRHSEPRMLRVDFSISSRDKADALYASLKAAGVESVGDLGPITDPGGGYGFSFRDPVEGRVFRVVADAARHADCADAMDRPRKISHVVLNSPDRQASFFVERLGFKVIDQSRTITFLNCNSDHHSLALYISSGASSFNHLAFEMRDIDSVMSATGNMVENGEEIGWGVGRHGPCNNVFCYFVGPGGFTLEYTAEIEQVDENYRVRGPDEWNFRHGRRDQWGLAKPTPPMHSPERRVPFSDALFENSTAN
jgi:catechol 2,3-dioxygenase-like lactoylglutathione lyase family enzyme